MNRYLLLGVAWNLVVVGTASAQNPKQVASFPHDHRVESVAFSPDGKLLASGTIGGSPLKNEVALWQDR